jgi:transcription antitermination protein NusB
MAHAEDRAARRRSTRRRTDTDDPRRSRERALKILFQADLRGLAPDEALAKVAHDTASRAMLDDLDPIDADEVVERARAQAAVDVEAGTTLDGPDRAALAPVDGFTRSLVLGVHDHRDEIDALIVRFARRWAINRMPVVDRTVLRLATYELLHEVTSPAVVINEAVELAKSLSTEDSGRYVNGVLESIRRTIAADEEPREPPS